MVDVDAVKVHPIREVYGILTPLGESIRNEGMHQPLTLWKDGTLISGFRRYRAAVLLRHKEVPVVFVNTIEDAAKRLSLDQADDHHARPMKPSEMCRLWELLRRLDEPAAALRADANRRRGVRLRQLTEEGVRDPGRADGSNRSEDYVLTVLSEPFDLSVTTAKRLWTIFTATKPGDPRRDRAKQSLADIDEGISTIWANYRHLSAKRSAPISTPKPPAPEVPAAAAVQVAAWNRSLPQLEGLVAGLAELGPPNPDLLWEQVGPIHTRLMAVRRDLEKMIKKMRESNQS